MTATPESARLEILERRVYRGPHLYSQRPMIRIQLDLGTLEAFPTSALPGLSEALLERLPGLARHGCSLGRPGGLVERMAEGTWLGHVIEHVAPRALTLRGPAPRVWPGGGRPSTLAVRGCRERRMRGEVLTFDEATGMGAIVGDDGARYLFTAAEVRPGAPPRARQRVEFEPTEDLQARNVTAVEPSPSPVGPVRAGYFDLGRVIQRTFATISRNAAVFFGAALVLVGAPSALFAFGQSSLLTGADDALSSFLIAAVGWVLNLVGMYVLQGMVVKAAVNGFNGKSTSFGDAFDVGVRMFLPLLGLAIVAGIGILIGFFLLIVPGVILCVLWSVAAPAVVVEKRGVFESLQRSRDLTRGHRWPVFGLLVIYAVLSWIIGAVLTGLGMATGGSILDGAPNLWVDLIAGPAVSVLSGVVASAGVAALYYELRTAKEGAGAEILASVFD